MVNTNPVDQKMRVCDRYPDESTEYYKWVRNLAKNMEKNILNALHEGTVPIPEKSRCLLVCLSCCSNLDKMDIVHFDRTIREIIEEEIYSKNE